ncbi:3D domain-containing protein [Cohnella panacarvi]|uniref:3D domain-containing protein n=1 Tax=Cohnella panacarvi TaxID=400776 RepID=UPI000479AFB9|nr:3D domain-containing protein [Cohnella panacarvi]
MNHAMKKLTRRAACLMLGGALLVPALTAHAAEATSAHVATDTTTFWKLSQYYGIPVQALLDANPSIDPQNIYAGLRLAIPRGNMKVAAFKSEQPAVTAQSITTSSGQSIAYAEVLDIKATAYSDSIEENGKWGAVDYMGNALKLGTIAVDPKVIPLGTKLYITGYEFKGLPEGGMVGTATDIGSAIKGNRVDIFVPGSRSFVSDFGVQNVKVYILK